MGEADITSSISSIGCQCGLVFFNDTTEHILDSFAEHVLTDHLKEKPPQGRVEVAIEKVGD